MKNYIMFAMFLITGLSFTSCKKDNNLNNGFGNRSTSAGLTYAQAALLPVKTVNADITSPTAVWDRDTVYEISGVVTVRSSGKLTIESGTYIKSTVNTTGVQNGVLVIAKDGEISAVGDAENPIIFTSRYLLDGDNATAAHPGDFGGVIILGDATINVSGGDKLIEGLADVPKFHYGGSDNSDDRGDLQYVRIEYAGFKLADNIEVNSLTLGGVGSGTTIDHVQASYGLDDGFEFFGGTVSPSYLVSLGTDDDQYDFDNGFTGTITYALAVADVNTTHSQSGGNSDSNGIESDNNAPGENPVGGPNFALTPKTHPILNHFTIIGTETKPGNPQPYKDGMLQRRGSEVTLQNSIITGFAKGIVFDTDASATPSTLTNVSYHGFGTGNDIQVNGGGSYTSSGLTSSITDPADPFNIGQPWFNAGSYDFVTGTGTRGALYSGNDSWADNWTKFDY